MNKIVIDARELRTSTGRYIERLLHYLQQIKGDCNEYVVLLKPKDFDGWTPTNPRFSKQTTNFKEFTFGEQIGFCRQITNMKANLVHFPMVQQPVFYRGKVITTMQDLTTLRFKNPTKNQLVFTLKQQVYRWVNKRVAKKSQEIITISNFVKQDIIDLTGISLDKITVTYEAADKILDSPTPPSSKTLQNCNFIMYVGRPTPHKNLWRLIEAFALLRKTHPSLQLVLAGKKDGNYDLIEERAQKEKIANGIIFTGFISDSELRWLYENCAAYAFPSLSEGFGLPGLEAMQHGAPVASSNATCLPEIHGDAAHYFDPLNINDMAKKIGEIIDDPKLKKELVAKGKNRVQEFSWQRMAKQTLAIYNKALLD
jgi:glycosyltransferase involved in cell wall biosynthesis